METKTKYSDLAILDLMEIHKGVIKVSSDKVTADNYIKDLTDKVISRSKYPEANSRLIYNNFPTNYYFIVFKAYLIFYLYQDKTMYIDRILYKKSNYIIKLNVNDK